MPRGAYSFALNGLNRARWNGCGNRSGTTRGDARSNGSVAAGGFYGRPPLIYDKEPRTLREHFIRRKTDCKLYNFCNPFFALHHPHTVLVANHSPYVCAPIKVTCVWAEGRFPKSHCAAAGDFPISPRSGVTGFFVSLQR